MSLLRSAKIAAGTDVSVLILGETGTGKECLANAIQQHSKRSDRPFSAINCAGLPESIAESILFGHRKGSFTGALADQSGILKSADKGTVFLDEVDALPLAIQAKLLRFIESGEIQPVGYHASQYMDIRIIAATNSELQKKVQRGEFRRDLYYRLNVVPLEIPPLRERTGDIRILMEHFMTRFNLGSGTHVSRISRTAMDHLMNYSWPGNVRELRNVCERLCILNQHGVVEERHLPDEIVTNRVIQGPKVILPPGGVNLEQVEISLILQALDRTDQNQTKAAMLLNISRDTLVYRMLKYGLR